MANHPYLEVLGDMEMNEGSIESSERASRGPTKVSVLPGIPPNGRSDISGWNEVLAGIPHIEHMEHMEGVY